MLRCCCSSVSGNTCQLASCHGAGIGLAGNTTLTVVGSRIMQNSGLQPKVVADNDNRQFSNSSRAVVGGNAAMGFASILIHGGELKHNSAEEAGGVSIDVYAQARIEGPTSFEGNYVRTNEADQAEGGTWLLLWHKAYVVVSGPAQLIPNYNQCIGSSSRHECGSCVGKGTSGSSVGGGCAVSGFWRQSTHPRFGRARYAAGCPGQQQSIDKVQYKCNPWTVILSCWRVHCCCHCIAAMWVLPLRHLQSSRQCCRLQCMC